MKLRIRDLSRCTGFPTQTLSDFARRGLLPAVLCGSSEASFNGLALLTSIEEVSNLG